MKLEFHGNANNSGLYQIVNLVNGRVYYGSTARLKKRAYEHRNDLAANKHANIFLQRDYNKCGSSAFIFEATEVVRGGKKIRLEKEQAFLDLHFDGGLKCYNLCPIAGSREGSKNIKPYNPTTDGRATSRTRQVRAIVSRKNKLTWNTPEKKEEARRNAFKRWNKHSANITVVNIQTGETVTIVGSLRAWCKERRLSYKAFQQMTSGRQRSSKSWTLAVDN